MDVQELLRLGRDEAVLKQIYAEARHYVPEFPTSGCATTLSLLLRRAGYNIAVEPGAGNLVELLEERGWLRIGKYGDYQPGDVFVTEDNDPTPPGADHVGLVDGVADAERYLAIDNHLAAHGYHSYPRETDGTEAFTPIEYWLRYQRD